MRARLNRLRAAIDSDRRDELTSLLKVSENTGSLASELLQYACESGERSGCVVVLLKYGASSDQKDSHGRAPLHLAVGRGDLDTVRVLLEAGANPNTQDQDGVTPLNLARSYAGTGDIAALLLNAGADPKLVDKHGKVYLM
ncbi:MAG: ankyrin repeat domain-containing protein [Leptospirales bacterium]|nr:ankyrin repeat domain-containing protein [Leptospirales bacterium]